MKLSENFTLEELTYSNYAESNKIQNLFDASIVNNLQELVLDLLQPFREFYGLPIRVTSGFRCEALNKALNGVNKSAHKVGFAADLQPIDDTMDNFVDAWNRFIEEKKPKFDEILIEKSKSQTWVHAAIKSIDGKQRQKNFELIV